MATLFVVSDSFGVKNVEQGSVVDLRLGRIAASDMSVTNEDVRESILLRLSL